MVEPALVLHLEGLPNLKGEDDLEGLALLHVVKLEGATLAEGLGLLFEHGLDVGEGALGLAERVHSMDVVAVEGFVEDDDGDVGDAAEVDEVFDGERPPDS